MSEKWFDQLVSVNAQSCPITEHTKGIRNNKAAEPIPPFARIRSGVSAAPTDVGLQLEELIFLIVLDPF